jgi:RHS repeat-associated protein
MDNINLFNGNLNFNLQLASVAGRGAVRLPFSMFLERHWRVEHSVVDSYPTPTETDYPIYTEWVERPNFDPGRLEIRTIGRTDGAQCGCDPSQGYTCPGPDAYVETLARFTWTGFDGTEHELIDQSSGGRVAANGDCYFLDNLRFRGTIFRSTDGSELTFISDSQIVDSQWPGDQWAGSSVNPAGYLLFSDGTHYRIDNGLVTWVRDRNGNKTVFAYDNLNRLSAITDPLNRQISIEYDVNDVSPYGLCDRITMKGFGGAPRMIRISRTALGNVLRNTQAGDTTTPETYYQLFPNLNGSSSSTQFNPDVISTVWLPNNQSYNFHYNIYGELARVDLPTGGAFEYDFGFAISGDEINRRVLTRRVYKDSNTLENTITYGEVVQDQAESASDVARIHVDVASLSPTGVLVTKTRHFFYGSPQITLNRALGAGILSYYPNTWKDTKEFKTEELSVDGTDTPLRRVEYTYQQLAHISWWQTYMGGQQFEPPNNPRLIEVKSTLVDTNQVSTSTFSYDSLNNESDRYEYDYGSGSPGGLVRHVQTTHVTSSNYTGTSAYLLSLPSQVSVFDSGGIERARIAFEYDNYASDGNHAGLLDRPNISGFDSSFSNSYGTRGNVTATTRYLLSGSGQVINSVTSYAQYDIAGNVVKTIDARGNATTIDFTDRFGAPDGETRSNAAPFELSSVGQFSYAFNTLVTNALGHTAYTQFDYYLGQPVDREDANGTVASSYYQDALDRTTKVIRAANDTSNPSAKSQTTFNYDDGSHIITTQSDQTTFNDPNPLKSQIVYDALARTIESRKYEGGSNYIAVQTQYDALGRAYRTSNPFRPWQGESAIYTNTAFDPMGRVISVTTPDNAVVSTSYSGNAVTVTDQAGKKRRSVTDALGRMSRVDEPNADGNLNDQNGNPVQPTYYSYDTLDNLIQVTQGSQTRTFVYDSLKRLTSANNPESGTVSYQYDNNGNLTQKTDARNVVTSFAPYDALNRPTTKSYSDGTPTITYNYDIATNGKGRSASVSSSVSTYGYSGYDALGRALGGTEMIGAQSYSTSYSYDLAGRVKTMTYPSGHSITNTFDNAGRLSTFTGNLGDGTARTYSTGLTYSSFGGMTREQYGTMTALYNKAFYNARGQMFDRRVSSVNDTWDWNRGRLIWYYSNNHVWGGSGTDNNGNLIYEETWVPPPNATLDQAQYLFQDTYTYDSLNRLNRVDESSLDIANNGSWQSQFAQVYDYDRYGNRTINQTTTWGAVPKPNFSVITATNQLTAPVGYSMQYDQVGNLTTDTYTGQGTRTYDAENRIVSAQGGINGTTQNYAYDANGNRVKRNVNNSETWQVYGIGGELLAEYGAGTSPATPQKEYGYRNGELLITADGRTNVALASNGGVASASSAHTCCGFSVGGAINGNNRGPWGNGEGWNDATPNELPDWFQVDFASSKTIDEIDVFSLHDDYTSQNTPSETQTFSLYGLLNFEVQYWNGSSWATIPGGSVSNNNKVWRKFIFSPLTTSKIRLWITSVPDSWSRLVELQAWEAGTQNAQLHWLVTDQLGTPRMVFDQTGTLANVSRHDYLPFGEELGAAVGGRTPQQGYVGDNTRQKFTAQEADAETGLDYFINRYHSSIQGRFMSPDPLLASAKFSDPQSWNRYTYCGNNPLVNIDPVGLLWYHNGRTNQIRWYDNDPGGDWKEWTEYSYYAGEEYGWVALDPRSNHYETGFETQADAGVYSGAMEYTTSMMQDPPHDPQQFDNFMQLQLMLAPVDIAEAGVVALGEEGTELLAEEGVELALKEATTATATETAQVILNRAAGKEAEAIVAKQLEAEGYTIVGSQVGVRTSQGLRFIDHLVQDPAGNLIAVEVKSGGGTRTALQISKDLEMGTQGATIVSRKVPQLMGQTKVIPTVVRTVPR